MRDLLFLAHRIPYPPNKGDKIRSFHILQHLAARARVHLGCFVDDPADMAHVEALRRWCADVHVEPLNRRKRQIEALPHLFGFRPLTEFLFDAPGMHEWVDDTMTHFDVGAIFLYCSGMAQYLRHHGVGRRVVMDFVDMDSDKWRQYARSKRWPISAIYAREAERLFFLEQQIAAQADVALFVSEAEAALFRGVAGSAAHDVRGLSNGVDHKRFAPGVVRPASLHGAPNLVFTGAMDYWANVDAVLWFADKVLPRIVSKCPDVQFTIVGSNPAKAVRALDHRPNLRVTGTVPDPRPYLAAADIVVAPLRIARGVQNKVLEAMAMGKPVVATPQAHEGIEAVAGRDLEVASTAESMAQLIVALTHDPARCQRLGRAGRTAVLLNYDWARNLAPLDGMLGLELPAADRHARRTGPATPQPSMTVTGGKA